MTIENLKIDPQWKERYQQDQSREKDHRSPYQRDRARILHSAAFRCLQAKTQIHAIGENDFYRTRLTHSLEVAQIGSSLRAQLRLPASAQTLAQQLDIKADNLCKFLSPILPPISLIETLCLAHDIGHPPFGHGGETALNYMMAENGGFEGNAQTFRILSRLEPYTQNAGMNVARRTLLGIVKYPTLLDHSSPQYHKLNLSRHSDPRYIKMHDWQPGKGLFRDDLEMFDWLLKPLSPQEKDLFCSTKTQRTDPKERLKTRYKSLDCSIMELADDIAYSVHDLEDAIVIGVVTRQQWQETEDKLLQCHCEWIVNNIKQLSDNLFSNQHYKRKNAIGALVNYFITNISWKYQAEFTQPLLAYNAELPPAVIEVLEIFKDFVFNYVIRHVDTQRIEYKGQRILTEMFQIFETDPERLLPTNTANRWKNAEDHQKKRVICDYIAGMSDAYALRVYGKL